MRILAGSPPESQDPKCNINGFDKKNGRKRRCCTFGPPGKGGVGKEVEARGSQT